MYLYLIVYNDAGFTLDVGIIVFYPDGGDVEGREIYFTLLYYYYYYDKRKKSVRVNKNRVVRIDVKQLRIYCLFYCFNIRVFAAF